MVKKEDIIVDLRELAFATRLKRLSDRLARDVTRVYKRLDMNFEARWFTVVYALYRHSPMSITELARSLGLTHTAIHQITSEILRHGLIESSTSTKDERQRLFRINAKGRRMVRRLEPVWKQIRLATNDLIRNADCDVFAALDKIERELDRQNMFERLRLRLWERLSDTLRILEYRPAFKKYFRALNEEWLREYFEIEDHDSAVLSDPNSKIIKKGGAILFAAVDRRIVATCALMNHGDGVFELSKMAVAKQFRGRGIGTMLIKAIIEKADSLNAVELYLQTNPVLEAANHLYKKFGFKKSPLLHSLNYRRPTIVMKLERRKQ